MRGNAVLQHDVTQTSDYHCQITQCHNLAQFIRFLSSPQSNHINTSRSYIWQVVTKQTNCLQKHEMSTQGAVLWTACPVTETSRKMNRKCRDGKAKSSQDVIRVLHNCSDDAVHWPLGPRAGPGLLSYSACSSTLSNLFTLTS